MNHCKAEIWPFTATSTHSCQWNETAQGALQVFSGSNSREEMLPAPRITRNDLSILPSINAAESVTLYIYSNWSSTQRPPSDSTERMERGTCVAVYV